MSTDTDFRPPAAPAADFWRSQPGSALPDGVNDVTDAIIHNGLVGVGLVPSNTPVATLDVASVGRSGVDGRVAGVTPFYVTGNLPAVGGVICPAPTPVGGAEFRHSNQTQGIGVAYNGIYATGSAASQDFSFLNRGAGQYTFGWQSKLGGLDYLNYASEQPVAAGQGFIQRWWQACVDYAQWYPFYVESIGPVNARMQWDITAGGTRQAALRLAPSMDCTPAAVGTMLWVGENQIINKKLVLFNTVANDQDRFYGFGINSGTLRYQIDATSSWNRWYAATGACASQEIFAVSGLARVIVDPAGLNTGVCTSGYLSFGTEAANVASIFSKRNVGGNANGLDFATGCTVQHSIAANGNQRFNHHGLTADGNAVSCCNARLVIDDAGTVGNEQVAMLLLAIENCGAPCGQGMPAAMQIRNNNGTSGESGRIAWLNSGGCVEHSSINGFNGGTLRVSTTTFQSTTANSQKPGGGVWTVFSDERLKTDIADYRLGLDILRGLRPVTYKYKPETGFGDKEFVGLIAQQALEVAPSLVDETPVAPGDHLAELVGESMLILDTNELTYAMLNAIKALDARLAALEGEAA